MMKNLFKKIALSLSLLLSIGSVQAFAYSNNSSETAFVEESSVNHEGVRDSILTDGVMPYAIDGVIPPGGSKVFVASYKMGFSSFDKYSILALIGAGVYNACKVFESQTGRLYKGTPEIIAGLGAFVSGFISERPTSPTRWAKVYYTSTTTINGTLTDRYLVEMYKDPGYSQYDGCEWYHIYRAS